jgi:hypothetical protein
MLKIESVIPDGDRHPRIVGYLINSLVLQQLLEGKKIYGLPEGAKVYKIQTYRPEDCSNVLNVWFTHESFPEVPWGNIIELRWADIDMNEE